MAEHQPSPHARMDRSMPDEPESDRAGLPFTPTGGQSVSSDLALDTFCPGCVIDGLSAVANDREGTPNEVP